MLFIVIISMLLFEVIFNILLKYFRYNFKSDNILIVLILLYVSVWISYILRNNFNDEMSLVCLMGIVQGLFSIIEIVKIQRKYRQKEYVKASLIRNSCRIVAFEWVEELNDEELETVINIGNSIEGKTKKNFLVIAKEKDNKYKLMIFIYKENDCNSIKNAIEKYSDIDYIKENRRKLVIACNLRRKYE